MNEIVDEDRGNDPYVAYGIDVGMYEHGTKGAVNSNTTFAWARVAHGVELQSGASATVRALSIGRMLFSLLDIPRNMTQCVTGPTHSACIELFEGFVAGNWKLPRDISRYPNEHCWDAVTTAAAFQMAIRGVERNSAVLHSAMSYSEPLISHWQTIVGSTGLYTKYCDTDCMVVGIDSRSLAKTKRNTEN